MNMKGNAMHTGCVVYAHWRGLLITGSVMSEAAGRVSVVGLRRLPFIRNWRVRKRKFRVLRYVWAPLQ